MLISIGVVLVGCYDFVFDVLCGCGVCIVFYKVVICLGKLLLFVVLFNGVLYFGLLGNLVFVVVG